jgi:hypothetical protein
MLMSMLLQISWNIHPGGMDAPMEKGASGPWGEECPTGKKKRIRKLAGIGGLRPQMPDRRMVSLYARRQAASVEHGRKDETSNNPH